MKRSRPARSTARTFRRANPYVKLIRTGRHRRAVFNRLASINHRNSCFLLFQLSSPLPFPFVGALSLSPDLRQTRFFPSLSVSPTLPENMRHTNKTTQAAQRISMLFLSYRRATNERTVSPFFRPFFFPTIVFYPWERHRPYPCCRRRN